VHTTDSLFLKSRGGDVPTQWNTGDTYYQKAKFIAAVAWAAVKDAEDPELTACDMTHQQNLIAEAESQMAGNQPGGSPFSHKVAELVSQLAKEDMRK
jgi:hypothetical protein